VTIEAECVVGVTQTYYPKVTVYPETAENKKVIWYIRETKIAWVNQRGMVTGRTPGTTTLTVTTVDGEYTATCTVTVR
jgi:uncharacterized protein YjdB